MKTTKIQPKHQGGTQTTAGMSEPVETLVAEGMLARHQHQQGVRTVKTITIAGTRGLPFFSFIRYITGHHFTQLLYDEAGVYEWSCSGIL